MKSFEKENKTKKWILFSKISAINLSKYENIDKETKNPRKVNCDSVDGDHFTFNLSAMTI